MTVVSGHPGVCRLVRRFMHCAEMAERYRPLTAGWPARCRIYKRWQGRRQRALRQLRRVW